MTNEREKAHDQMRQAGYTDDSHAPCDTCLSLALFYLLGLATVLAAIVGKVTI